MKTINPEEKEEFVKLMHQINGEINNLKSRESNLKEQYIHSHKVAEVNDKVQVNFTVNNGSSITDGTVLAFIKEITAVESTGELHYKLAKVKKADGTMNHAQYQHLPEGAIITSITKI